MGLFGPAGASAQTVPISLVQTRVLTGRSLLGFLDQVRGWGKRPTKSRREVDIIEDYRAPVRVIWYCGMNPVRVGKVTLSSFV